MNGMTSEAVVGDLAIWRLRFRWLAAIGFALVPVVFTASASAVAQIVGAGDATAALIVTAGTALSAVIGLLVMARARPRIRQFGFRSPRDPRRVLWFVPLPITVIVAAATQGIQVPGTTALAYAVLTIAVAVNEEAWFRGIIVSVLRDRGVRVAIIGSSVLFGVLHLSNLAGGADPSAAALQVLFAVLFGVVAAELVVLTGSLWPAIIWHAVWDFVNYLGGNATSAAALVGVAVACAVMLAYAIVLWRRATAARA